MRKFWEPLLEENAIETFESQVRNLWISEEIVIRKLFWVITSLTIIVKFP